MKIPKCDVGMYDPKGHPLNRMRAKKLKENGMVRLKSLAQAMEQQKNLDWWLTENGQNELQKMAED